MNPIEIGLTVAAIRRTLETMPEFVGETDAEQLFVALNEAVPGVDNILTALCRAANEADTEDEALDRRIDALRQRQARVVARREAYRRHIATLLDAAGLTRWKSPEFTVSLTPGRPGVVITDPAAIPDAFVRVERKPDKTAIGAALASGNDVPGADMRNGAPSLTIRTK